MIHLHNNHNHHMDRALNLTTRAHNMYEIIKHSKRMDGWLAPRSSKYLPPNYKEGNKV